jgi:hypothetical protein
MFFLVVVPALVLALSESGIAEPRYPEGLLVFLAWIVAERIGSSEGKQKPPNVTHSTLRPQLIATGLSPNDLT